MANRGDSSGEAAEIEKRGEGERCSTENEGEKKCVEIKLINVKAEYGDEEISALGRR